MPNTGGLVRNSRTHAIDVDNGEANADRKCRDMPLRLGMDRGRLAVGRNEEGDVLSCLCPPQAGDKTKNKIF